MSQESSNKTFGPKEPDYDDLKTSMSLVNDAQMDDQAAWYRLVKTYTPLISYWCRKRGIRTRDVTDCCQDVFLKISQSLPRFRKTEPSHTFRGWLYTITRYVVADFFGEGIQVGSGGSNAQEMFAAVAADEECEDSSSSVKNEQVLLSRRIMKMVEKEFSELYVKAFTAVVIHRRKPSEVAEDLGTSVDNIYKAKCRILARIREEFPDVLD